jgi:hypothetical protein
LIVKEPCSDLLAMSTNRFVRQQQRNEIMQCFA